MTNHSTPRSIYKILLMAVITVLVGSTEAATQRMFLPTQSLTIKSGDVAVAQAMCLDYGDNTPKQGQSYTPSNLGDVRVSAPGHPEMSIKDAIAQKILAVSGTGNARSLSFRSLLTNGEIRIAIKTPSVMLPGDNVRTADLSDLPELAPGNRTPSQPELWQARAAQVARKLGMDPAQMPEGYQVNPQWMAGTHDWVRARLAAPSEQRAFVLQRVLRSRVEGPALILEEDSRPVYILYVGDAPPRVFRGNGELLTASTTIKRAWRGAGGTPPPRIMMIGNGELQSFDAARLTLEAAAGGNGGGTLIGDDVAAHFSFEPPRGPRPPGEDVVYRGGAWETLRVARREDEVVSARQGFFNRGHVTVFSRTLEMLGRMAAAVRGITENPIARASSREHVIEVLKETIADEVAATRRENQLLSQTEGDTPSATFVIDGKTTRTTFKQVFNGELRRERQKETQLAQSR